MSQRDLAAKLELLQVRLRTLGPALIAYSGGVDSSFLLKIASDVLGKRVLAVTALSETYPESEMECAERLAKELGVRHRFIRTRELRDPRFRKNPENRCYFCKSELFGRLRRMAKKEGLSAVWDGSNVDDLADYRPGAIAKKENGILSPLQDVGLTKSDIRSLSKRLGLKSWCKPALACLASRIPYHSAIDKKRLLRVDRAETVLRNKFDIQGNLRVRDHGMLARVEVDKKELKKLSDTDRLEKLLRPLGYKEIVIDKKGYRTGSMNEDIGKKRVS